MVPLQVCISTGAFFRLSAWNKMSYYANSMETNPEYRINPVVHYQKRISENNENLKKK